MDFRPNFTVGYHSNSVRNEFISPACYAASRSFASESLFERIAGELTGSLLPRAASINQTVNDEKSRGLIAVLLPGAASINQTVNDEKSRGLNAVLLPEATLINQTVRTLSTGAS